MRWPNFLITGEMKCGSTTLWDLVTQDSRVHSQAEKELHYLASYCETWAGPEGEAGGHRWYLNQFAGAAPEQLCGEATPNYLNDELACDRIAELMPEVRLLVILRDPVSRAWSHYWHQVRGGTETLAFERAIDAEPERMKGDYHSRGRYSYVGRGHYIHNIKRFEATFSREQLCVVLLDDLRTDLMGTMRRVWSHIGLEPPYPANVALPHQNKATFPRWPMLDRLTRQAMATARSVGGPVVYGAKQMSQWTRSWRTYQGAPRMDDNVRQRLEQTFTQSDRELANWLGCPLPWRQSTEHLGSGVMQANGQQS